jgi:hypothetical protein
MSDNLNQNHQKTIPLTKLDDTSHYRLWRVATEATFDVYNVLGIVNGAEPRPTAAGRIPDWNRRHKLAREALFTSLRPAQLNRVSTLQSAKEIWDRLADEYGKVSELKRAQLNAKLSSLRKSPQTSMRNHIDEFENIIREIEFHSAPIPSTDANVAFLVSLGDTETWKNYRNSNIHRAITMKTTDLLAEVTLIDDTLPTNSYYEDQANALSVAFRGGYKPHREHRGSYHGYGRREQTAPYERQTAPNERQNVARNEHYAYDSEKYCMGCKKQGHDHEECTTRCNFCREFGHLKADCLKRRWKNEQCKSRTEDRDVEYKPSFESRR